MLFYKSLSGSAYSTARTSAPCDLALGEEAVYKAQKCQPALNPAHAGDKAPKLHVIPPDAKPVCLLHNSIFSILQSYEKLLKNQLKLTTFLAIIACRSEWFS